MTLQEQFEKQGNFLFKYRSYLPLIIIVAGLLVYIFPLLKNPNPSFASYTILVFVSLAISFIGFAIRVYTVGHTPANTSGRNTAEQIADELNTTGIYSMVRHPLYLGNFFMWLGATLLTANGWFVVIFVLVYWLYYERIMYAEEQFLQRKFGEAFLRWAEKTPTFIPNFHRFVSSRYPFSWKKAIKKEKNGLAAIFILLFIFYNIRYSFKNHHSSIDLNWIFWVTLLTILLYLVLKFLKKETHVLDETGR